MSKRVKCRQCGKQIDKQLAIEIKPKMYVCCDACRQEYQAKQVKNTTKDPRKALFDYIKQLDHEANFAAIASQVKRMADEYMMTYAGMQYALWYSINIKQLPYKGVGILPYVYEESRKYWHWQQRMKQQVADWTPADDDVVIMRHDKEEDVFV